MLKNLAKKISITLLISFCLWGTFSSTILAADSALVQCGREGSPGVNATSGTPLALGCGFADFIKLINTIINYLIIISMPLAAVAFAWAGWLYLSAGEDTGKVKTARAIFTDVGIGLIILLSGWLVFKLIADNFLNTFYAGSTFLN